MTAPPAPSPTRSSSRCCVDVAPLALLLLATVAALWPVCRGQFVEWDDQSLLYQNPTLNPPAWADLQIWWTTPHQRLYTPVAYTVWGGLAWLAQVPRDPRTGIALNPHVFHAANLVLHLLTATVVYFLLKRLLGLRWPAAAGAMLFAIHPVQVESVAHASGIQGLLCGFFGLTAVLLYLRAVTPGSSPLAASQTQDAPLPTRVVRESHTREAPPLSQRGMASQTEDSPLPIRRVEDSQTGNARVPDPGLGAHLICGASGGATQASLSPNPALSSPRHLDYEPPEIAIADTFQPGTYALATAAFILALLSKPAAMTVPILAAVLQVVYLRRSPAAAIRFLWPWVLLALPCAIVARAIQKPPRFDVAIPFHDRPLIAGYAIAFYLGKIVFPWRLGIVYPRATPAELMPRDVIYYTWLVPTAITALLWERRRQWRPLIAAALWFLCGLLPVLGFTRFDFQIYSTVADRYLYLPMFGVALAAGWILCRPCSLARPKTIALACAILLAVLGIRSWFQTLAWHDTDSLFRNAHTVNSAGGRT